MKSPIKNLLSPVKSSFITFPHGEEESFNQKIKFPLLREGRTPSSGRVKTPSPMGKKNLIKMIKSFAMTIVEWNSTPDENISVSIKYVMRMGLGLPTFHKHIPN